MKKKTLIDIDVVAVAQHYVRDKDHNISKNFIESVKSGSFETYTTHSLLDLVEGWESKNIKEKVLDIYSSYSYVIPDIEIEMKSREKSIIFEKIVEKLSKKGVKEEDGALAVIASLFGLSLITLNRKHLRNKRDEINKVLKEVGLNEVEILLPNEI